jgi:hypothetical protein
MDRWIAFVKMILSISQSGAGPAGTDEVWSGILAAVHALEPAMNYYRAESGGCERGRLGRRKAEPLDPGGSIRASMVFFACSVISNRTVVLSSFE